MPTLATIPRSAATPPRALDSGPAGKVFTYRRSDYLASPPGAGEPQAFLVREPGSVIPPHFDCEIEFEVSRRATAASASRMSLWCNSPKERTT